MTVFPGCEKKVSINTKTLWFALAATLLAASVSAEEARVWTSSKNGSQFRGTLLEVSEDSVTIQRESDQSIFKIPKADLIQADQAWIKQKASKDSASSSVENLSNLIASLPTSSGAPAIGVLLIMDGTTKGIGVAGKRKAGSDEAVTQDDKWHLGSCTKSMTATLAATFVEEGKITWDTTIDQILGNELSMLESYRPVTLEMLLANRGGVPGQVPNSVYEDVEFGAQADELRDRELLKQRAAYVEAVLNLSPSRPPGTGYEYSNSGYVIAGAMLEQLTGKPWETLIQERIFDPLNMSSAGFGNAAHDDSREITQPWPHQNGETPVSPEEVDDNSWVIGPAGTVHASLKDMARYLVMHANRETGPVLQKKDSFAFLHQAVPRNQDYARGWIVARTGWSQGPALTHDGSNTMNYCSIWIAPERQAAVAAFTNCGDKGRETCMEAIRLVASAYLR